MLLIVPKNVDLQGDWWNQSYDKLPKEEEEALWAAFGRRAYNKASGKEVVNSYQSEDSGKWFICKCRGEIANPPVITLRSFKHIVRKSGSGEHSSDCDFYPITTPQREIVRSYRQKQRNTAFNFLASFDRSETDDQTNAGTGRASHHTSRSKLGTLLAEWISKTPIGWREAGTPRLSISPQYEELKASASEIWLDTNVTLSDSLCAFDSDLDQFKEDIFSAPANWSRRRREHGIYLTRVGGVGRQKIETLDGRVHDVVGRLAIFGETDGSDRAETISNLSARQPYLAVILVGRRSPDAPATLLSAYLHPCVDRGDLLLVDSDLERITLRYLQDIQDSLPPNDSFDIQKPMFDLDAPLPRRPIKLTPEEQEQLDTRDVLVPDFVLWPTSKSRTPLVVETMGYDKADYRQRKRRTQEKMRQKLNAELECHDFHQPYGTSQEDRDEDFINRVRAHFTAETDR